MQTFKSLAYEILKEHGKPMHVSDITKVALKKGLVTSGRTPKETMNAQLITEVNRLGDKSKFIKTAPATFSINLATKSMEDVAIEDQVDYPISDTTTKQRGDIAEARIAELIILYGETEMSCYKPISDDEGIDLMVKKKGGMEIMYLQVKSRFSKGLPKPYTANVKTAGIRNKNSMGIVFCSFDYDTGDLWDYLWYVPAPDFLEKANKLQGGKLSGFVSGTSRKASNKWEDYLIDKRQLSMKLSEIMERM